MATALMGAQIPRVATHPAPKWSDADDCAFLASSYGLTPDPWQMNVLNAWMGRKADGKWAAGRWGLAVPRQNGKNGILEMVELFFMVALGLKILHTAHEVKTARKAFARISSFFENERRYPELAAMVKELRRTNGQEAIILHAPECSGGDACDCKGGGSIEFIARSKGSGRGFTVDVLVCDEAQEYGEDAQAALLPTISSAPSGDPLQILLGTPPSPTMDGSVFTRMRDAGIAGKDKRLAWCEWSVVGDVDVSRRELWAETNPSLGIRLNWSTTEDEFAAMSAEMFARERLGRWESDEGGKKAISFRAWGLRKISVTDAPREGRKAFAVRFSVDGSAVALAAATRPDVGPVHVAGVRFAPMSEGTAWLIDWLIERKDDAAQIVVEGKSGAGWLVQALRDEKVSAKVIITPTSDQAQAAHSMFEAAVNEGHLTHHGQPELDAQVKSAVKRKIGVTGGFGWQAPPGETVALLDAVTMAHWAAKTTKRKPGRKAVAL